MKKSHYLSEKEREQIGEEFERDPLYRHLRPLALNAESLSKFFSLSPEDLYFLVLEAIDTLWEQIEDEELDELEYCRDLWLELKSRFAEGIECDESDHALAATLTVCTTCNLLTIMDRSRYWSVRNQLMQSTKVNAPQQREQIENIIEKVLYNDDTFAAIECWMEQYYKSKVFLSDKIAEIIIGIREQNTPYGIKDLDEIVSKLKGFFWNDTSETEKFIKKISGQPDLYVIEAIGELVNNKPQKMIVKNKSKLWTILHDCGLYSASKVNFSKLLKDKHI